MGADAEARWPFDTSRPRWLRGEPGVVITVAAEGAEGPGGAPGCGGGGGWDGGG